MTVQAIKPTHRPAVRRAPTNGLSQAYELRELAHKEALALRDSPRAEDETSSARAQAIAAMIRAWDVAGERLRILQGKPMPGSLRPTGDKARKTRKPAVPVPSKLRESLLPAQPATAQGGEGGNGVA